jgi:hypothetical protein
MLHVNLAEKLLVPILAKLANFIPEAGIWMNTQRPEWNDANNALVGYGVSMVTLCYLRRHLAFCRGIFESAGGREIPLSEEVADLFDAVLGILRSRLHLLDGPISDAERRSVLDGLGRAGSGYRARLYKDGFTERRRNVPAAEWIEFIDAALRWMDHSIRANRRPDGLYHAYNLLKVETDGSVSIRRLYEMLEGQVAVLSSGLLTAEESLEVLDALAASSLYRKDQSSYILYPDRQLPRFVEKNNIPSAEMDKSVLMKRMVEAGDRRIVAGGCHEPRISTGTRNAPEKRCRNHGISARRAAEETSRSVTLQLMPNHRSSLDGPNLYSMKGRGIYWHMVSVARGSEVFIRAAGTVNPQPFSTASATTTIREA